MTFANILYFMLKEISFLIILFSFSFISAENQTIDFTDLAAQSTYLASLQGQRVQIRGFWYPLSDHKGILSSQPDLKSCCYSSPSLVNQQIIVKGDLSSTPAQRAVTLEGILRINVTNTSEGTFQGKYLIEEARIHELKNNTIFFYLIISLILFALYAIHWQLRG